MWYTLRPTRRLPMCASPTVLSADANSAHSTRRVYVARLLILSACNAGDISAATGLLWEAVRAGINVIAALRPVHDYVSAVFFTELYRALLPTRHAAGIELTEAIRAAVATARRRLVHASGFNQADECAARLDETLAAFVLYGDPTLHLKLIRASE